MHFIRFSLSAIPLGLMPTGLIDNRASIYDNIQHYTTIQTIFSSLYSREIEINYTITSKRYKILPTEIVTSTDIVSGIHKGNKNFEALLVKKYSKTILYIIEKRCGDPELAKDICQETFLVLLEKFRQKKLEDPEKLAAYVRQTAVNILIASKRKEARRQTYPDSEVIADYIDQSPTQLDELEKARIRESVRSSILEMKNQRDREILYRYYVKEYEKPEICKQLKIDFRHFDKVISRARNRLKESLIVSGNDDLLGRSV